MRAEEWEEIKHCFESALKLSEAERGNFLTAACDGRTTIRRTVEELLQAHQEASGFLDVEKERLQVPPVFQEGQLVAERFRIARLIARGGMGEVYEAFDQRLSIRLALKTLRQEYASDQDALERFRREICVTRDFGHPNLCRVYELVEHHVPPDGSRAGDGIVTCLTMQLMSGETLQQYRSRAGPLSLEVALPLIRQIAGAIDVLHTNDIIHRDLKPSNIMIGPGRDGELRAIVMDFGLTKPLHGGHELFESRSDFQAGAPFYLAPELLRGDKPSIASDIYALGLIIDDIMTSSGAFVGDSVEALLYQKLWSYPIDPRTRAPGLPDAWCQTICRCLNSDPAKRFGSAIEVVAELTLDRLGSSTQSVPLRHRVERAWRASASRTLRRFRKTRWRTVVPVFVGSVLAGGGALAYIVTRPIDTSVLIFDFENLTGNSVNDYVSTGTGLEIQRRLLEVPGVRVRPYHGPAPKDASLKPKERFSMEGRLQSSNGVTRLTVQVIDNRTASDLWIQNFDARAGNSLEMEDEIASGAVNAMRDALLLPTASSHRAPGFVSLFLSLFRELLGQPVGTSLTQNEAAMEAYTRGRVLIEERRVPTTVQAVAEYNKALQADPNLALAYADLVAAQFFLIENSYAPRFQLLAEARRYAQEAVAKGPNSAESYTALAAVNQSLWNWREAAKDFRKAIKLNPSFPRAHRWYGGFLLQFGSFDESLKEMRHAVELDPYDYSARLDLALPLLYSGKSEEAAAYLQKCLGEHDYVYGHQSLGYVYARLAMPNNGGRRKALLDRALHEAEIVAKEDLTFGTPDDIGEGAPMYALFYALRGDRKFAQNYLRKLEAGAKTGSASPEDIACVYIALGDRRSALEILRRGIQEKDSSLIYLKVNPFFEPLNETTEFRALVDRMGLNSNTWQ